MDLKLATDMVDAEIDDSYANVEVEELMKSYASIKTSQSIDTSYKPMIKFQPKQFCKLDEKLEKLIKQHKVTIPIIYIRDQLYLVGTEHQTLTLQNNEVLIGEHSFS